MFGIIFQTYLILQILLLLLSNQFKLQYLGSIPILKTKIIFFKIL